jgi:hypothetical protein
MVPLGRMIVDGQATPIFSADRPCTLVLWVSSHKIEDTIPSVVYISGRKDTTTFSEGTPLEGGPKYEIPLDPGDTLWAITPQLALIGFMVVS